MAEQEVVICEAQLEDASGLAKLLAQVTAETDFITSDDEESQMTVEEAMSFIQSRQLSDNQICLVAHVGNELVSVLNIAAASSGSVSHIGDIFVAVAKKYWGYGLGQFLMEAAIDWAEHSGIIRRLELTVQKRNEKAVHIYEKFGFRVEGIKERGARTKDGEFLDVYLMSKLID